MSPHNHFNNFESDKLPPATNKKNGVFNDGQGDKKCHRESSKKGGLEVDFESAINLTGYGRFHYKLVAVCALCLITNGLQNGLAAYVFPATQTDLLLTSAQLGFLNVSFLVGGVCSAFLWGALADLVGRRKVLLYTLILDSLVTLLAAAQCHFIGLLVCRYFNGFLSGASGSITFNYVSEFHAAQHRIKSVCYSGIFYTSAWLLLPVIAFGVLPLPAIDTRLGFGVTSWRLFLAIVAVPEFLAGALLAFLPESPKYAMEKDRDKALRILARMYAANKSCKAEDFSVKALKSEVTHQVTLSGDVCVDSKVQRLLAEMWQQFKKIFTPPLLHVTIVTCLIMFSNMFGYFGLGLWLPELFLRFEQFESQFPNATASVKHLAGTNLTTAASNTTSADLFNMNLFQNTLAIGMSSILGNVLSGLLSGKVAIKFILLATLLVGGLTSGLIYWLQSSMQNLIASCLFQAVMTMANITINSLVVDVFPTNVAGMALCLAIFVGRISGMLSNLLFGLFMDSHCEVPIFAVSLTLISGAVLCLCIPAKKALHAKKEENYRISVTVLGNIRRKV